MRKQNRNPDFIARRNKGQTRWTAERRAKKSEEMKTRNADPTFRAKQLAGIQRRAPRGFTIPKHTHPIVRGFFVEMNNQGATRRAIKDRSSVSADAITGWRTRNMPLLDMIDAALNSLDLELAIVPRGSRDKNGFLKQQTFDEGNST